MLTVTTAQAMNALSREWKTSGRTVGFVPTMGSLHEGHLSLVRESKKRAAATAVSIFVNPAQFGPKEDYKKYPRDFARDAALLEKEGVDAVFFPTADEMYPRGYKTYITVQDLEDRLCGKSRPGHFRGVATVVLKLFNIVEPDLAFFGWKDAQQVIILRRMAADLNLGIEIVACPLVRETDGLAMSSRNAYLSRDERQAALVLSRSLAEAEKLIGAGERDAGRLIGVIRKMIEVARLARLDYVEITDMTELRPLSKLEGEVLVALAVYVGTTRLIDNIRVRV
jgi:pantoate--beta-alanine ligase